MISLNNQTIFKNRKSIKELKHQIELIYKYYDSTIKNDVELIDKYENELAIRSSKINTIFIEANQSPSLVYGNGFYKQTRLITQEIPWFVENTDLRTINNIKNHYLSIIGIYINVSILTLIINTILCPVRWIVGLPSAFVKFLLNAINIKFSDQNKTWEIVSGFINLTSWILTSWIATVLPLWEILRKLLHF